MKKHWKKIVIGIVAILLVIVLIVINVVNNSITQYASTSYVFLYGDEIKVTPSPEPYTDDPCECVYMGKKLVSGGNTSTSSNNSSKNTNAGQITGKNSEEKIWNYLCGKYDEMLVAGIMGNLWAETGGSYSPQSDNGSHYGIVQWSYGSGGGRWPALKSWASKKKLDPEKLETQLKYIPVELGSAYYSKQALSKCKKALKNDEYSGPLYSNSTVSVSCKTYKEKVEVLAIIIARHYEVCKNADGSLQSIDIRVKHAKDIYKKYNSKGIKSLDEDVASINLNTSNFGLSAFAKKSNTKKTTTGKTSGSGGQFKTPTYKRHSSAEVNKKLLNTVKHILPGAVACQEYYGLSAISALAQARKEGFEKSSYASQGKSNKYQIYGIKMANIFTGNKSSGGFCQYSSYSEAVVGRCYNFISSSYYGDLVNSAKNKENYKKQIHAIAYSPYCASETHDAYYDEFIHMAYSFINGGDWSDTTVKYNYDDIGYAKQCIVAWGLEKEYASAVDWIKKYEDHKKTSGKAPAGFGELDGKAIANASNSSSSVDISDVATAQKLLKFTDKNMDKKIKTFTFEADLSKCEKVDFEVYMPKNDKGVYALDLVNKAGSFGQSQLQGVVVHHTLGGGDNLSLSQNKGMFFGHWNSSGSLGSHFGIASNGKVYQWLSIDKESQAQNDQNGTYLSIEVGDDKPEYKYTKKAYKSLVHLVAYLCVELNVDITCKFRKNSKNNLYWDFGSGLMRHYDCKMGKAFRGKACPSNWSPADGSVDVNVDMYGNTLTSKGGNTRWLAFKADVYRYIANHQKDKNFKISGIKGLSKAKKLAKGHTNEFDWSNVDSLLGTTETNSSSGTEKKMWLCDCEIPCSKCHCHDNESPDEVGKGIGGSSSNNKNSNTSSNNTTGNSKTETEKISNVAQAVVKGHCKYIKDHNVAYIPEDGSSYGRNHGRYAQAEYSTMTIDGKKYTGFRRDCTGFMTAIFKVLGDYNGGIFNSGALYNDQSSWAKSMRAELSKKWTQKKITPKYKPKKGDVLVKSGHAEMYYDMKNGRMRVWNWGSENNYSSYTSNGYKPINSKYNTPQSYEVYWRRNTVK